MKEKFKVALKRISLFFKEILNLLGNILVPIVSLLVTIAQILPIPTTWVAELKKFEYWLFYASGTAKDIGKILDDKIEELEKGEEKKSAPAKVLTFKEDLNKITKLD